MTISMILTTLSMMCIPYIFNIFSSHRNESCINECSRPYGVLYTCTTKMVAIEFEEFQENHT